jgi:hypothetical protein
MLRNPNTLTWLLFAHHNVQVMKTKQAQLMQVSRVLDDKLAQLQEAQAAAGRAPLPGP